MANRRLSEGDKTFIVLVEQGNNPSPAFREAYPEHPAVIKFNQSEPGSPDRKTAAGQIKHAAKQKLAAQYMQPAIMNYQEEMEEFSQLSLKTAKELVKGARSEKVRADLAIEGIRHKVGSPTVKIASKEEKVVYLTFDKPPEQKEIIDIESDSS